MNRAPSSAIVARARTDVAAKDRPLCSTQSQSAVRPHSAAAATVFCAFPSLHTNGELIMGLN